MQPRPGPPFAVDDLKTKRICDALREGHTRKVAANSVGVSTATFWTWLKRGTDTDEEPYATFARKVHEADAEAERRMSTKLVELAESGDLRAVIFWLQKRRRDDWGEGESVVHRGKGGELEFVNPADNVPMLESLLKAAKSAKLRGA